MIDPPPASAAVLPAPRGLFVLLVLYGGMAVLAGFLAFKQVSLGIGGLAVEAGIFAFLLLVAISSTVAQLYGERTANRLVWWGFVPLAVSIVLIALVLALPPPACFAPSRRPIDMLFTPRLLAIHPAPMAPPALRRRAALCLVLRAARFSW